ncbi:hypothetical protein ACFLRA_02890 [Bdellovibrionota bacterium]
MADTKIPDETLKMMKDHLGYNDEEIEIFKKNPRNAKVLAQAADMMNKTIVFEVIEAHGCNSQHKVGTKFYFSGDGNLISKMAPSKVCAFVLPGMTSIIYAMQELWYAGVDPNEIAFNRTGCFDVGVGCGGWGHVVYEGKVMDREEAAELHKKG